MTKKDSERVLTTTEVSQKPIKFEDKESVKAAFAQKGLEKYWTKIEPLIRTEIRIYTTAVNENKINIGQSKIGGLPDMPKNKEWFKENNGQSLSFIAQINCSELNQLNQQVKLPDHGIIYFFYSANQEAWGFDIKNKDKFKVYYSENTENLERKKAPEDIQENCIYKSCTLTFKNEIGLPSVDNELIIDILSKDEEDSYMELTESDESDVKNKLFGYSNNIQGEMELECQLVTNGIFCGDPSGYNDPQRVKLEKGASDWNLLLQVDSDEEKTGMMWGDTGRLYFWIKKQDLEHGDFSKSWFSLQCY